MTGNLNNLSASVSTTENLESVPESYVILSGIPLLDADTLYEHACLGNLYISKSTGPGSLAPILLKEGNKY